MVVVVVVVVVVDVVVVVGGPVYGVVVVVVVVDVVVVVVVVGSVEPQFEVSTFHSQSQIAPLYTVPSGHSRMLVLPCEHW